MSWVRQHKVVSRQSRIMDRGFEKPMGSSDSEASVLPEVYAGHPSRTNRYSQYDQMDMDSQVWAALNTIADFSTQSNESNSSLFQVKYNDEPSDSEVEIIESMLRYWTRLNKFKTRLWRMFRNVIKYGDEVMIRDPETYELYHVEASDVESVVINEAKGKKAEYYLIQNLNVNISTLTATSSNQFGSNGQTQGTSSLQNPLQPGNFQTPGRQGTFGNGALNTSAVSANHIMHLSLSEGLDAGWPFGTSILESVYKDFKQKQLLEDAVMIYRIQRAPERRVFYVDVGNMPPHKAHAWVERMKNDVKQKRFPSRTSQGMSVTDARYDPMSMIEDYWFPQTAEGRGSRVDTLPGGQGLGNIDDLNYFNNKLAAGLGVPQSYLTNPGSSEQGSTYTDGRPGTAYIQEFRFSEYCQRLQRLIEPTLDKEFKLFMKAKGFNVDPTLFDIELNTPQHFSEFAKMEKQGTQVTLFTQLVDVPYLSRRFLMMEYLGMTYEDIARNEQMWLEENSDGIAPESEGIEATSGGPDVPGLNDVNMETNMDMPEQEPEQEEGGDNEAE